jgi:hypothetical protein
VESFKKLKQLRVWFTSIGLFFSVVHDLFEISVTLLSLPDYSFLFCPFVFLFFIYF